MSEGFLGQNSSPFTKMCSSARCRPNFSWHIIHSTIQILQNPHVTMWTMIRRLQSLVGNSYGAQARLEHTQSLHHVSWCYCACSSCYIMLKHYTNTYKIVHEFWLSASISLRHSRLKSATVIDSVNSCNMVRHDISKKERFVQTLHAYLDHSRTFISSYYILFYIFLTATRWHRGPPVLENISECPCRSRLLAFLIGLRTWITWTQAELHKWRLLWSKKNGDNMEPPRCLWLTNLLRF